MMHQSHFPDHHFGLIDMRCCIVLPGRACYLLPLHSPEMNASKPGRMKENQTVKIYLDFDFRFEFIRILNLDLNLDLVKIRLDLILSIIANLVHVL